MEQVGGVVVGVVVMMMAVMEQEEEGMEEEGMVEAEGMVAAEGAMEEGSVVEAVDQGMYDPVIGRVAAVRRIIMHLEMLASGVASRKARAMMTLLADMAVEIEEGMEGETEEDMKAGATTAAVSEEAMVGGSR